MAYIIFGNFVHKVAAYGDADYVATGIAYVYQTVQQLYNLHMV